MKTSISIPTDSKAWVYQSPREFTQDEILVIDQEMKKFIASWESHGSALKGYYEVLENRFILVTVDESAQMATGCSIDKSVGVVKVLEEKFNLNLTDKGVVVYVDSNDTIQAVHFSQVKGLVQDGEITPETTFYNAAVATFGEFMSNWKIPAKDSWLSRYF